MRCHDGAEICDLVGTFILNVVPLSKNRTMSRLYRDDILATFRSFLRPNIERKKKEIMKIFKS